MAGLCRLKLSALRNDIEYPMNGNVPSGRCLIHVKLTDFCVKSIESLMDSEKGAFFTLFFEENGGKMSIPVDRGDPKVFQFKTAPLEGEGQGSLECVHQEMGATPTREHSLSCWGVMEHRLTVQGTDEVYARTKKQMEIVAERRKEQRAQEVKVVPQGGRAAKVKSYSVEKVNPMSAVTMRKHNRSRAPVTGSAKHGSLASTRNIVAAPNSKSLHQIAPKATTSTASVPATTAAASTTAISVGSSAPAPPYEGRASHKSSGRNTYSLKQRVIYTLAVKPQNRETIVTKLKKATKRSENAMTNLDSILEEVSEVSQGLYRLKPHYFSTVDVDQWPFYTDAQKQMLKRIIQTKSYGSEVTSSSSGSKEEAVTLTSKRTSSEQATEVQAKKPKLSDASSPQPSPPPMGVAPVGMAPNDMAPNDSMYSHSDKESPHLLTFSTEAVPSHDWESSIFVAGQSQEETNYTSPSRKHKKKKKKKKKEEDSDVMASDPTSTSHTPEYLSQFPWLSGDEERHRYKQTFNREYEEYLQLKSNIDEVSSTYKTLCSGLSERLNSVPKHSEEYKETKKSIQEKYREFQRNRSYIRNKSRFDELHQRLSHIKQMVLDYDGRRR